MTHDASRYRSRRNWCRCLECTEDHRRRHYREQQARYARCAIIDGRRFAIAPHLVHGTYNTYSNHGCRCEPCRAANSAVCAEYRRRRAAAS